MVRADRLSQDTLFDFLAGTGIPLVRSLVTVTNVVALWLAIASLAYATFALAWWPDGLWNQDLPWSGALPSLVSLPLYLLAWWLARRQRMQAAAVALFAALFLLSMAATWPRGAFCAAWYLQPFLALLTTCCTGIVPGLSMTLASVVVLLLAAAHARGAESAAAPVDLWSHATSLAAVTLASALTGALMHQVLLSAVRVAEQQRQKSTTSLKALRHRERLLRHAMRVETVGDLAGMVSHQLRNAFQVMMGHVTLATTADEQERGRRLALIGDILDESRPLLDDLMGLAHPDEGAARMHDLVELVANFHDHARRVIPAAIEMRYEAADLSLPVLVNPRGLEHALWNLVINARQAIDGGGVITMRTGRHAQEAWVEIADTGCGIPETIRPRIFDPYFTTKPPGQGTGLGLAAVERFVRGSNGRIDVASQPGRGTTFRLEFPLLAADGATAASA